MTLLLDTHVLIWILDNSPRFHPRFRAALIEADGAAMVSVVSLWEIVIKAATGRLAFPVSGLDEVVRASGFSILPVVARHVLAVSELPPLHRDPFDRLLVAQAATEGLTLMTEDEMIRRYTVNCL